MSEIQFKNQFPAELASSITTGSATLPLKSGHGANFPAIAQGEDKHFFVTIVNSSGAREIVKIVQRASGSDTLVVGSSMADQPGGNASGRAQEGTTALGITYTDPHVIELRLTAGIMQDLADRLVAAEEDIAARTVFVNKADGSPCISDVVVDIASVVAEGAWESFGPTGSGAANIWTALNGVPTDVDWIEVAVQVECAQTSSAATVYANVYARNTGSSVPGNQHVKIANHKGYCAGGYGTGSMARAKIPVSGRIFEATWSKSANTAYIQMVLVGYGYN